MLLFLANKAGKVELKCIFLDGGDITYLSLKMATNYCSVAQLRMEKKNQTVVNFSIKSRAPMLR